MSGWPNLNTLCIQVTNRPWGGGGVVLQEAWDKSGSKNGTDRNLKNLIWIPLRRQLHFFINRVDEFWSKFNADLCTPILYSWLINADRNRGTFKQIAAKLLKRGVSSSLSYGEKFADLRLADWNTDENCVFAVNHTKFADLLFADWHT